MKIDEEAKLQEAKVQIKVVKDAYTDIDEDAVVIEDNKKKQKKLDTNTGSALSDDAPRKLELLGDDQDK